jgi:hypothetical protein
VRGELAERSGLVDPGAELLNKAGKGDPKGLRPPLQLNNIQAAYSALTLADEGLVFAKQLSKTRLSHARLRPCGA